MLEYNRKALGEHLKEIRERANLTQREVSSRLGYSSPQFISNIERGISVTPLPTLAKMLKIYRTKPDKVTDIIMQSQKRLLGAFLRGQKPEPRN